MDNIEFLEESQVRDADGNLLMVFRGDFRARSLKNGFKIQSFEKDGGSGGLYFTDNSEVASGYASTKEFYEEGACETHLHLNVTTNLGMKLPLTAAEMLLTSAQKENIERTVLSIDSEYGFSGDDPVIGKNTWNEYLVRNKGNHIKTCIALLFHSGILDTPKFIEFWEETGIFKQVEYDDPYAQESTVTPVYLDIRNPLDANDIPEGLISTLKTEIGQSDATLSLLEYAKDKGTHETITVVSTPAREALLRLGYDGIKDYGGYITDGDNHNVWIALKENQVVSAYSPEAVAYRQKRNATPPPQALSI